MSDVSCFHPSWIEIDLVQFRQNISIIRKQIGSALFCLPIKANAYGHGLIPIAKEAQKEKVDYLAVAHLSEGEQLRKAGIKIPILVLGAIHEDQIKDLIEYDLEFSISSKFKADLVAQKMKGMNKSCKVHLEVDTGMQRTGVRASTSIDLMNYMYSHECFNIRGVYSHFATSDRRDDPVAKRQFALFSDLKRHPTFASKTLIWHLANSGGTLFYPEAHFDMVRPSLLAFGYMPQGAPQEYQGIAPCFSLKSKISYFKVVSEGEGISYGHSFVTKKQTRVVTVPIGYGDGYRRSLSNKGSVLIRGACHPIVGTICMDQLMVDIGDKEAYVGDEVVLIGKQGDQEITINEIADLCDTIPYEVLCFFNDRIPRVYRS